MRKLERNESSEYWYNSSLRNSYKIYMEEYYTLISLFYSGFLDAGSTKDLGKLTMKDVEHLMINKTLLLQRRNKHRRDKKKKEVEKQNLQNVEALKRLIGS
jgi:hypothetical protein